MLRLTKAYELEANPVNGKVVKKYEVKCQSAYDTWLHNKHANI